MLEVRAATPDDRRDVVRVMSAAFDDDPVTRWLVPAGRPLDRLFAAHARWSHYAPGCTDLALLDGVAALRRGEGIGSALLRTGSTGSPGRRTSRAASTRTSRCTSASASSSVSRSRCRPVPSCGRCGGGDELAPDATERPEDGIAEAASQ